MRSKKNLETALTFESVWATFNESDRRLREMFAETDRQMKESREQMKENEQMLTEKFAETDRRMKETDRRMKELQKELGGMGNSYGSFAEEYFFNSFENGKQNFFREDFDEIEKSLKAKDVNLKDEYDIVMYNGNSVAIVEVKFKAGNKDIPIVLNKAKTFRFFFPCYKGYKIYLGLASLNFPIHIERECIAKGIAVIKQVGENVVINDGHLKVF
jgi:hypothetical protein